MKFLALLLTAAGVLAGRPAIAQQGPYTPGDVEDGKQLFLANCANCHGTEGDAVPGVDLSHGQFRRASSDDDLSDIIRRGIQGTAMPPSTFPSGKAVRVGAFLRSLATPAENAAVRGDATRGKALFEGKGQCLTCHRVNGNGSRLGPDVSDIGLFRRAVDVERAIVQPS